MPSYRVTCRITDEYFLDEWVALKPPLITMWIGPAKDETEAKEKASLQHLNQRYRKGAIIKVTRQ